MSLQFTFAYTSKFTSITILRKKTISYSNFFPQVYRIGEIVAFQFACLSFRFRQNKSTKLLSSANIATKSFDRLQWNLFVKQRLCFASKFSNWMTRKKKLNNEISF